MKRLLIDLDVLTNAFWKGGLKDVSIQFLERVKAGEFELHTLYVLIESVMKWKDRILADKILDFYKLYSREIITVENLSEKLQETDLDYIGLSKELTKITNKEDDTDLVLISSIFDLDFLVTFNRKHLRNKKEQILEFLKRKNIKPIKVVLPNEI